MNAVKRIGHHSELRVNWYSLGDAFDNTPMMVHALNASGKLCYANSFWLNQMGYLEEEVIGRFNGFDFLGAVSKEYARDTVNPKLIKEGKVENVHHTFKKKSGELIRIVMNAIICYDSDGDYLYGLSICTPINDLLSEEGRSVPEQNAYYGTFKVAKDSLEDSLAKSEFIYKSDLFRYQVIDNIEQVVNTDATVLIVGESGTGKELVANSLHNKSLRSKKPFVKVNCAALPPYLIESELFGHIKGSFTGAIKDKVGKFELADGGTIFLDEIGELPLELQPKLLRVLQESELERLGDNVTKKIDLRIIAATNKNLEEMVDDGTFRQDLYYRLNVFPITMPALRDRKLDIIPLATHFLDRYSQKFGKSLKSICPISQNLLEEYFWPGNIRELQNIIERSVIKSHFSEEVLKITDDIVQTRKSALSGYEDLGGNLNLKQSEKGLILKALKQTSGKVGGKDGAAELLGLKRTTLIARMNKLNIDVKGISS